jgi:glycosyltransferase involved in cell wall biosynthesis
MVSIVIPAFNEEAFLPRLLASIKAQDYTDYEIIVADNDSRDGTREVARSFGARVVSGGIPGVGRNRGADAAQGEHILFLDADTVIPEGFISKILARFEKDFIDICIPWIKPIDGTKPVYSAIFQFSNTFFKLMESIQPQGLGVCILVTRRLHRRIGGFSEKQRVSEDFDYINRASLLGRFRVYTNVYVYHSVRRYKAEGVSTLVKKQARSGFLTFFTGKAYDTEDYEFGGFSHYLLEERNGKRAEPKSAEVKRLLSNISRQGMRLEREIEKLEKEAPKRTHARNKADRSAPEGNGKSPRNR